MAYGFSPSGVNAQTGTSYTFVDADILKLVTLSNVGAVAVTLPQAGAASSFLSGWVCYVENLGAGTVTITPTTSTIDGSATLTLTTNQGCIIFSDGTNYKSVRGIGSAASGTVTHTGNLTADQVVVGNGTADLKILAGPADATKFLNGAATPAFAQVTDANLSTSNITTNDVSITKHGFAPVAPNDATKYLDGTGAYSVPAGGSSGWSAINARRHAFITAGGDPASTGGMANTGGEGDSMDASAINTTFISPSATAGPSTKFGSGSTATACGLHSHNNIWRTGKNISGRFIGFLSRITDTRFWYGFTDQSLATMSASDNPAGNYAAFRYSATGGDTNIQCITKDNTTQTVVDSGIPPVASTSLNLAIVADDVGGTYKFYINGTLKANINTHLPTSGSNTAAIASCQWVTTQMFLNITAVDSEADY